MWSLSIHTTACAAAGLGSQSTVRFPLSLGRTCCATCIAHDHTMQPAPALQTNLDHRNQKVCKFKQRVLLCFVCCVEKDSLQTVVNSCTHSLLTLRYPNSILRRMDGLGRSISDHIHTQVLHTWMFAVASAVPLANPASRVNLLNMARETRSG